MYAERPATFALGRAVDAVTVDAILSQDTAAAGPEIHHLQLAGRILVPGGEDAACTVTWVRGRTARVSVEHAVVPAGGDRGILYLDLVGRIEGAISWIGPAAIEVEIAAPAAKWARLQQQFAMLMALAPADRENLRGQRRIALDAPDVALTLGDGQTVAALIRDVSRSGAAVTCGLLPEVGQLVTLGSTRGRVVRWLDGGFAVQFLRLLPLERFGAAYRL